MFVFASSVTKPEVYSDCAERGVRRAAEPDSVIWAIDAPGTLFESYNQLLDRAAEVQDLDALVLVHQDAEIVEDDFCAKARDALSDPDVGVVGCVGAIDVRSIAWWEGSVALASFIHRYPEHGGGDLPAFSWAWSEAPPYARVGEVDTVDGFLLVLSPWVVRNIHFDESLGQLHGYDFDFCLQVREAGKKVVTADFRAIHNHSLDLVSNPDTWIDAHMKIAEKWDGRLGKVAWAPGTWKERARRAEAERDAFMAAGQTNRLQADARALGIQRGLTQATTSISWRLTAPLRRLQRSANGRP